MSATAVPASHARAEGQRSGLRVWPLRRPSLVLLLEGGAALVAIWAAVGLVIVHVLDGTVVQRADEAVPRWLEDHRSPTVDSLTYWGSMLADTVVKIMLIAIVGGIMVKVFHRWHDALMLACAVICEATVFLFSSLIVDRPRPEVAQLDPVPPTGSFPSGHMAAATAFYGALFVIVCWHTTSRRARWYFGTIAVVAPLVVGTGRIARGMHHPLDVLAGAALGVASVLLVRAALQAGVRDIDEKSDPSEPLPDQVLRLDLTTPAPSTVGRSPRQPSSKEGRT